MELPSLAVAFSLATPAGGDVKDPDAKEGQINSRTAMLVMPVSGVERVTSGGGAL